MAEETRTVTKTEIMQEVSDNLGISSQEANKVIEETLACIAKHLYQKESVSFRDFGSFSVQRRSERKGRNPQTGETMICPAKDVVKFKPYSKVLVYVAKV